MVEVVVASFYKNDYTKKWADIFNQSTFTFFIGILYVIILFILNFNFATANFLYIIVSAKIAIIYSAIYGKYNIK